LSGADREASSFLSNPRLIWSLRFQYLFNSLEDDLKLTIVFLFKIINSGLKVFLVR